MDNYDNRFVEEELEDDGIITLRSADGEEIDFLDIAGIAYGGKYYAIVQPVELLEGMAENEALVFLVERDSEGNDRFTIEMNDDIIDAVFVEYNKLYEAAHLDEQR